MKKQDYHCDITVNAGIREAYESISKGVPKWWSKDFEGSSEHTGDKFTIRFVETFVEFKIAEAVTDKKIVWEVTDCYLHGFADKTEWTGTRMIWEFSTEKEQTRIDMTHAGLDPEVQCYETCVKGWDFFVKQSLYKLLTEKKGMPNQPAAARVAVNV